MRTRLALAAAAAEEEYWWRHELSNVTLEAGPTPRLDTAIGRVGEFLARYAR